MHGPSHISAVKETSICNYLMVIHTPILCENALFADINASSDNQIKCQPIVTPEEFALWKLGKWNLKESLSEADFNSLLPAIIPPPAAGSPRAKRPPLRNPVLKALSKYAKGLFKSLSNNDKLDDKLQEQVQNLNLDNLDLNNQMVVDGTTFYILNPEDIQKKLSKANHNNDEQSDHSKSSTIRNGHGQQHEKQGAEDEPETKQIKQYKGNEPSLGKTKEGEEEEIGDEEEEEDEEEGEDEGYALRVLANRIVP
jgi:hypothetical protein